MSDQPQSPVSQYPRHYTPHTIKRYIAQGLQKLYKFENGYGASVVPEYNESTTYMPVSDWQPITNPDLFELAVLGQNGLICYTTPVTDDVVRYQTPRQINVLLDQIAGLN